MKRCILAGMVIALLASLSFSAFLYPDIRPGYGVTGQGWISDYFPPLRGTNMDTPLFFMDSGKPGATFLLIGGTHAREIAGTTAATIFVENVQVTQGRVIVLPFANRSALSIEDELGSSPHFLLVEGKSGPRFLVYGDRRTDIRDQGIADPEVFVHDPSGMEIADGAESRNLNRNYPGKPDGNPTQQLAFAILEMIRSEDVDFCLDMHESGTPDRVELDSGEVYGGSRLAYMLVCHPQGLEIGAMALFEMEDLGISMQLEESSTEFRGLSHREIGDHSDCLSFLSESPNPGQDRWRKDPDVLTDPVYSLAHRVGMHYEVIRALFTNYELWMGNPVCVEGLPRESELVAQGIGAFLN